MSKLISTEKLARLAKALDNRIKVSAEELTELINDVKDMFGGRSLIYLTQLEYNALSKEEKEDETKSYFITDAEDLTHTHENREFLDSLSQLTLDDINSEIDMVEAMFGGKSLVYVTQAEFNALSDDEKASESVLYIITDMEQMYHVHENMDLLDTIAEGTLDAGSVNGYKIWVGTTAELEEIEEKDPFTVYFEIDEDGDVAVKMNPDVSQTDYGQILLTMDKYQRYEITENKNYYLIQTPDMTGQNEIYEIHAFICNKASDVVYVEYPDAYTGDAEPELTFGYIYKLDALHIGNNEWLVDCKLYSNFR